MSEWKKQPAKKQALTDDQLEQVSGGNDALDSLADALLALKEKARDLIVLHY